MGARQDGVLVRSKVDEFVPETQHVNLRIVWQAPAYSCLVRDFLVRGETESECVHVYVKESERAAPLTCTPSPSAIGCRRWCSPAPPESSALRPIPLTTNPKTNSELSTLYPNAKPQLQNPKPQTKKP